MTQDEAVPVNTSVVSDEQSDFQSVSSSHSQPASTHETSTTTTSSRRDKHHHRHARLPLPSLSVCVYGIEREYADPDDHYPLPVRLEQVPPDHQIHLAQLRKIASQGLEDEPDRGIVWRVLLGYLSTLPREWKETLEKQRDLYTNFVQDLFGDCPDAQNGQALMGARRFRPGQTLSPQELAQRQQDARQAAPPEPRVLPLSMQEQWKRQGRDLHVLESLTRSWNALSIDDDDLTEDDNDNVDNDDDIPEKDWKDTLESAVLLDEIRKDVVRTHPDLRFYLEPDLDLGRRRYAALERILFVWSKYNKGVRYVQGMNEIVATLYYVLANDHDPAWATFAEADCYALFSILIADMRDVFCPDLDDADTGIQGRIATMQFLLNRHDPEVEEHLQECGIDANFYAVRWWTTLLSREFLLPDTIRLWDSMLASTHKDNFLRYVCVTMVLAIRQELLLGDMSTCLRLLQSYPAANMDDLLESSRALWIYESQITLACHKGGISLHQALQTIHPPPGIIMAFGLRGGVLQLSSTEQLEQAGEKAAATVREATTVVATQAREAGTAVATQAKGMLGRASRLYSKYSQEYSRRYRSQSADGASDVKSSDDDGDDDIVNKAKSMDSSISEDTTKSNSALPEPTEDDKLYLDAILNA